MLHKYPQLEGAIEGAHFPAPPVAGTVAAVTQVLQLAAIPLLWFGEGMGSSVPEWVRQNKMALFLGLFVANTVAQNMAQTGAFEIEVDGDIIFSKMAEKRMPRLEEIVAGLSRKGLEPISIP